MLLAGVAQAFAILVYVLVPTGADEPVEKFAVFVFFLVHGPVMRMTAGKYVRLVRGDGSTLV